MACGIFSSSACKCRLSFPSAAPATRPASRPPNGKGACAPARPPNTAAGSETAQEIGGLVARHGRRAQKPLPRVTSQGLEGLELLCGFHAFGDGPDVDALAKLYDRPQHFLVVNVVQHAGDELPVELDCGKRCHAQPKEIRIAAAEVVKAEPDAHLVDAAGN